MTMEIPIAIHKDDETVYGVTVPDIPGVHSWGDTIDDAIRNTKEAIAGHVSMLVELGCNVSFTRSTVEEFVKEGEHSDALWVLISVSR